MGDVPGVEPRRGHFGQHRLVEFLGRSHRVEQQQPFVGLDDDDAKAVGAEIPGIVEKAHAARREQFARVSGVEKALGRDHVARDVGGGIDFLPRARVADAAIAGFAPDAIFPADERIVVDHRERLRCVVIAARERLVGLQRAAKGFALAFGRFMSGARRRERRGDAGGQRDPRPSMSHDIPLPDDVGIGNIGAPNDAQSRKTYDLMRVRVRVAGHWKGRAARRSARAAAPPSSRRSSAPLARRGSAAGRHACSSR